MAMLNEWVKKIEHRIAGLSDPLEDHRHRPLSEHVRDFVAYLSDKGSTPGHVMRTSQQLRSVIDGCKFKTIDDLSASVVQAFLKTRPQISYRIMSHFRGRIS